MGKGASIAAILISLIGVSASYAEDFAKRQGTLDDYAVEVRCSALFGIGYGFAADLSLEGKDRVPFNLALNALASDENIPSSMRDRSLLEAQIRQAVALEFQQYTQYFRSSIIKADISGATKITETQVWQTD